MPPTRNTQPAQSPSPSPTTAAAATAGGQAALGAGTAAVPAAGAAGAAVVSAPAAELVAAAVGATIAGFLKWALLRKEEDSEWLTETLREKYPDRPRGEIEQAAQQEVAFEKEFQRRMRERLERDLPVAFAEADPEKRRERVQSILEREARYIRLREEAKLNRAVNAVERSILREYSPDGAYWWLSPDVKEHTPDCVAFGQRFWPWEVLNKVHPPMHHGCACRLFGKDEALSAGWIADGDIPETMDAVISANEIIAQYDLLEEAEVSTEDVALYLQEARYDRRWGKGLATGGQFRPMRGGVPGLRSAARRALRAFLADSRAVAGPDGGRFVNVDGRAEWVPERGEKVIPTPEGDLVSPPGSTNLYRVPEGLNVKPGVRWEPPPSYDWKQGLVSTPRSPGIKPLDTTPLPVTIDEVRRERRRKPRASAVASVRNLDPNRPPISEGAGPDAFFALEDAGFRPTLSAPSVMGGLEHFWTHIPTGSTLRFNTDERMRVTDVRWEPGQRESVAPDRASSVTPATFEEFQQMALALAHQIGDTYNDGAEIASFEEDSSFSDTAGMRGWDGEVRIGPDARTAVETAAQLRDEGVPLNNYQKEQVYRAYQCSIHELVHCSSLSPYEEWPDANNATDEQNAVMNLEEALTEEISHVLAAERLRLEGQLDVLAFIRDNPDAPTAIGVYEEHRTRLARILDEAQIAPENREGFLFALKFKNRTANERFGMLGKALHESGAADTEKDARDLAVAMMSTDEYRPAPAEWQSVLRPDYGTSTAGKYEDDNGTPVRPGATATIDEDGLPSGRVIRVGLSDYANEPTVLLEMPDGTFRYPTLSDIEVDTETPLATPDGIRAGTTVNWQNLNGTDGTGWVDSVIAPGERSWKLSVRTETGSVVITARNVRSLAAVDTPRQVSGVEDRGGIPRFEPVSGVLVPRSPGLDVAEPENLSWADGEVNYRVVKSEVRGQETWYLVANDRDSGLRWTDLPGAPMQSYLGTDEFHAASMRRLQKAVRASVATPGYEDGSLDGFSPGEQLLADTAGPGLLDKLKDGEGAVEQAVRGALNSLGVDPYDVNWASLDLHSDVHEAAPRSRLEIAGANISPCANSRSVDFAVHVLLPELLREKYPVIAEKLRLTSPRWGWRSGNMPVGVGAPATPGYGVADEAVATFRRLQGMNREELAAFAAENGGKLAPEVPGEPASPLPGRDSDYGQTIRYLEGVLDGRKPAGFFYPESQVDLVLSQMTDAGWRRTGVVRDGDEEWSLDGRSVWVGSAYQPGEANFAAVVVSPDLDRVRIMRAARSDRSLGLAWQAVLDGTVLGYSDADIAAYLGREDRGLGLLGDVNAEEPTIPAGYEPAGPDAPRTPGFDEVQRPEPTAIPNYDDTALTLGKGAGGSNGARWAFDETGRRWLIKTYRGDQDRVATELLANRVYAALGVPVADAGTRRMEITDGRGEPDATQSPLQLTFPGGPGSQQAARTTTVTALAYPTLDGETRKITEPSADLGSGYMADALIANWDFVGLTDDNVLWTPEGKPVRIDQGGTFERRAQGAPKEFGPVPTEVWTMLSPKGQGFGKVLVSEPEMREQARHIARTLTPGRIDSLVDAAPFRDVAMRERIRENLTARVAWMRAFANGEEGLPEPLVGEEVREALDAGHAYEVFPLEEQSLRWFEANHPEVTAHLRSGAPKQAASLDVQAAVSSLDELIGASEPLEDDAVVFSGLTNVDDPAGLVGRTFSDKSFGLMTLDEQKARQSGVMMRVTVPAGSRALRPAGLDGLSDLENSDRVILPRGARYRVVGLSDADGVPVLDTVAYELPTVRPVSPVIKQAPMTPGLPVRRTVSLDGEEMPVVYTEVNGLPTTTRVFAAFAAGAKPAGEDDWIPPAAPVAFLTVDTDKNTLELAYTDERFRRQGLADSLLEIARLDTGSSLDTDTGERSPLGREWANAANVTASPEGGKLNRDLTQEEADKLGERMLTDIKSAYLNVLTAPAWGELMGRDEPTTSSVGIREIMDKPAPMTPGLWQPPGTPGDPNETRKLKLTAFHKSGLEGSEIANPNSESGYDPGLEAEVQRVLRRRTSSSVVTLNRSELLDLQDYADMAAESYQFGDPNPSAQRSWEKLRDRARALINEIDGYEKPKPAKKTRREELESTIKSEESWFSSGSFEATDEQLANLQKLKDELASLPPDDKPAPETPGLPDRYEVRDNANEWLSMFSDTESTEMPSVSNGKSLLLGRNGEPGKARSIYLQPFDELVASVTYNETDAGILIGTVFVQPEHRGQGLFDVLMEPLVATGKPIDAWNWENESLREKVTAPDSPYQPDNAPEGWELLQDLKRKKVAEPLDFDEAWARLRTALRRNSRNPEAALDELSTDPENQALVDWAQSVDPEDLWDVTNEDSLRDSWNSFNEQPE